MSQTPEFSSQDHQFMLRAITLAKQGHYTTSPNPRVGCVLVKNGEVVGEGFHAKAGEGHAEVNALKQAGARAEGATAYVTLEPCSHFGRTPPCAQGLVNAKVKHVIAAMVDPNPQVSGNGLKILEHAGISTQVGLLKEQAQALNPGFIKLMTEKMPFVRCKLAASLDGKTAMANGESKWITSPLARQDVQRLRAQSCAIISGVDSVVVDNAKMTVRWSQLGDLQQSYPEEKLRQPVRVIIDPHNKISAKQVTELALFAHQSLIILASLSDTGDAWPEHVEQLIVPATEQGKLDLKALLALLARRGLNDILLESGARLCGAFIEQDLVDELVLYQAGKILGDDGKGLAKMPTITQLSQAKSLAISDVRLLGPDIRITGKFEKV